METWQEGRLLSLQKNLCKLCIHALEKSVLCTSVYPSITTEQGFSLSFLVLLHGEDFLLPYYYGHGVYNVYSLEHFVTRVERSVSYLRLCAVGGRPLITMSDCKESVSQQVRYIIMILSLLTAIFATQSTKTQLGGTYFEKKFTDTVCVGRCSSHQKYCLSKATDT